MPVHRPGRGSQPKPPHLHRRGGFSSQEALNPLARWAATTDQYEQPSGGDSDRLNRPAAFSLGEVLQKGSPSTRPSQHSTLSKATES